MLLLSAARRLCIATACPPTAGLSIFGDLGDNTWLYLTNLVGAPSQLQREDESVAIEGLQLTEMAGNVLLQRPASWQVGGQAAVTVVRNGQPVSFTIPVVHWTPAAWLGFTVAYLENVVSWLGSVVLLSVGFFTFLKRPGSLAARVLLVLCSAIFANMISSSLPDGLSVLFDPIAYQLAAFYSYSIFVALIGPSLLAFTLVFPRPKPIIERHRWLVLAPYAAGFLIQINLSAGGPATLGWLATMAMILLSIASLIHSALTMRDVVSRAQLRWAIGGMVLGLGLALLTFPAAFGLLPDPLERLAGSGVTVGFAIIGVCLSIAILRYRLFDIDVIIRKTLLYGTVTGLLALVYLGSVVLLQRLFEAISGQRSPIAIVISTLAIAALFSPLRSRVQAVIDRRFFRRKYDAEQTLVRFAQMAQDETDLDRLMVELARVVGETVQPTTVGVWLRSEEPKVGAQAFFNNQQDLVP